MTQIPSVADAQRQGSRSGEEAGLPVGSPAWFAWLADDATMSFSFRSPAWSTTWPPPEAAALLGAGMGLRLEGSASRRWPRARGLRLLG
jgi:hypothetical protein